VKDVPSYDEIEMFQKIAEGDENAFSTIFHKYNARLFPFVCRLVETESIAEEIVQEVFLRLWIHRANVGTMDRPDGWLYKVASNLSLSQLRRVAIENTYLLKRPSEDLVTNNAEEHIESKEIISIIEKAVTELPPKRQQIYRLSRQGGLNPKEIADELDLSQTTVKNQLVIASKFVRDYVTKSGILHVPVVLLAFFKL
jgi:RNA polymerase sigma-70 factor (ECF subfamily)